MLRKATVLISKTNVEMNDYRKKIYIYNNIGNSNNDDKITVSSCS